MELQGEAPVEGRWVDRVVGLDAVRQNVAMPRSQDGHGRLELVSERCRSAANAIPQMNYPATLNHDVGILQ